MIAKMCTICKDSKPLDEFYKGRGECKACHRAKMHAHRASNRGKVNAAQRQYYAAHPEIVQEWRARVTRETLPAAHHHYQEWVGSEMDILARGDLTAFEKAKRLGRTYYATRTALAKLKRDASTARSIQS